MSPLSQIAHCAKEDPQRTGLQEQHTAECDRYDKYSCNHQCTCMALTLLTYTEGLQFNTDALYRVLQQGDLHPDH